MQLSDEVIHSFQNKILQWYYAHKRDLPWRKTRNPYHILVSEVMLQQTQVARVLPKYAQWLEQFPTVYDLANASTAQVLTHWSGLGYNRRALNLMRTAETVANKFNGTFPETEEALLILPGIGKYTAHALLSFAFNKPVPVVDTNVKKVILVDLLGQMSKNTSNIQDASVLHDQARTEKTLSERELWEIAWRILPRDKAYDWNQALMDYSSAVLKKEKILLPKQTKFHGSRRYYRGHVVKLLITHGTLSKAKLGALLKDDFAAKDTPWLEELLIELSRENFIIVDHGKVSLMK